MVLAAGDMLTDNLELECELGHGGMGAVWLARNVGLGSKVAVKVLKRLDTASETEQRARFEQEARGLAQLDHPNLVKIWDFGITLDGDPFIVMELLKGEDLSQRLKRVGPIAPRDLAPILAQVCRALAHIHAAGIVHRDIKPANLFLLERDGETTVKLVDFGVAKFAEENLEMTKTGTVLGTPYYMSPEQLLRPKSIDGQSDLWSLAVVAYVALTGKLPFDGETLTAVGMAVAAAEYTSPSAVAPKLPSSIDAWMKRALTKDSTLRFASPRHFAQAFEEAATPAPNAASNTAAFAPTTPVAVAAVPVVSKPSRRRSAMLMGAGLLALGGVAAGWFWSRSPTTPPTPPPSQTPSVAAPNLAASGLSARLPSIAPPDPGDATTSPTESASGARPSAASASASASVARAPSSLARVASVPAVASSAAPSSRSTSAPAGLVQSCWRDNEGAEPGTPATTLKVAVTVTPAGRATAVRIDGPGRSNKGVVACSVQRLTAYAYGPGADEVLSFAVSLPATQPKSGP